MALTPGTRLGVYDITAPIGEGGMGQVFRARDTKLDRDVAIKILPDAFAHDADRLARFTREAKTLASLNHPHIAGIYGLEESAGVSALVMELVEGEDLSQRIARGAIPLDEALPIAKQIAEALEAAHEQGIIHRDLKPANIKVRADGTVKVLDFGLAKAIDPASSSPANAMNSPTLSMHATKQGVILGTAAYMAPEQARGKSVDKRADIWAFGVVLYEILTGRTPFAGDTVTDIIAAVVTREPDWSAMPATTPASVRQLLGRCIEKDPKRRLRDIGEARVLLSDPTSSAMKAATPPSTAASVSAPPARMSFATTAVAGLVIAAIAGGVTWSLMRPGTAPVSLAPDIVKITTDAGFTIEPAVAPSGSLIAYASDRGGEGLDIWVQPLPSGEPVQITHNPADDREPEFSPDGSRIVFRSDRDGGGIYEVPALGGTERLIVAKGRAPKFSPDGKWIAYWAGGRAVNETAWITDGHGGAPRALGTGMSLTASLWCRDGKSVIANGRKIDHAASDDWYSVDLDGGAATRLGVAAVLKAAGLETNGPAAWLGDEIVFTDTSGERNSLWAVPIKGCRSVAGVPHRLTTGTPQDLSPAVVVTADGVRLFYAGTERRTNIYRLLLGAAADAPVVVPLTDDATYNIWPSVSSDGRELAFVAARAGKTHRIVRDLAAKTSVDVAVSTESDTSIKSTQSETSISPNGKTLAAIVNKRGISLHPVAGGDARQITIAGLAYLWDWPRPTLITGTIQGEGRAVAVAVNVDTGKALTILDSPSSKFLGQARLSSDGHWMSMMDWSSADRGRVIIVPYDGVTTATTSQIIPITDGQTVVEENTWSLDSNTLYMVSEGDGYRCIWSRRLDPRTKQPAGPLTAVAHFHRARQQIVSTADSPQRLDTSPTGLIFAITERHGNIWMATVKR